MAVDLSKAVARPTQRRRSSGGRATAPPTQLVNRQDFARDVSGEGAVTQARAGIFGAFSQALLGQAKVERFKEQTDHIDQMHEIERENAELARIANTTALSRPLSLRRALESGNTEGFEDLPEDAFKRRAFVETAQQNLAIQSASQLAQNPEFISGLSGSDAPDEYVARQIDNQTQGMDPVFAETFATALKQGTSRAVTQRKAVMVQEAVELETSRVMSTFAANPPTDQEQLNQYIGSVRNAASPAGPQAEMDAQAALEQHILREAIVNQQPWAETLVSMPPEEGMNDGLTIRERYRDTVEKLEQEAINSVGATTSPESARNLNLIEQAITTGDLTDAVRLLNYHAEQFGTAENHYMRLRGQVSTAIETATNNQLVEDAIIAGQFNAVPLSDRRKRGLQLQQQWPQFMADNNIPQEEWVTRNTEFLRSFGTQGPDTDHKAFLGAQLEELDPYVMEVLKGMGNEAINVIPSGMRSLWERIERHEDPAQARDSWREAQANPLPYSVSNAMEEGHNLRTREQKRLATQDVIDGALELNPLTTTGDTTLGIPTDQLDANDADEVSPTLWAEAQETLREVIVDYPKADLDEAKEIAMRRMKDKIGIEYVDGNPRAIPQDSKLSGAVGDTNVTVSNFDAPYMEDANDWLADNLRGLSLNEPDDTRGGRLPRGTGRIRREAPEGAAGEPFSFTGTNRVDELSALGYGTAPEVNTPLGSSEVIFNSGDIEFIPPDQVDSVLFKDWREPGDIADHIPPVGTPDGWVARVVPEADMEVGPEGDKRLVWAAIDGQTHLRYVGPAIEDQTIQRLDDRGNLKIFSGQQSNPPASQHPNRPFLMRGAAKKTQDSLMHDDMDAKAKTDLGLSTPADHTEVERNITRANEQTRQRAEYLLDLLNTERGLRFSEQYDKFLAVNEGPNTSYVYDDAKGPQRITGKVVGKRTIGRGYNMERGDWDQVSAKLGLTRSEAADVFQGKRELTGDQLNRLNAILSQEAAREVYKMYKDFPVGLPEHFYMARMSLYHHGITRTPKMDEAMRKGDWSTVAAEIIDNSWGGLKGTRWENGVRKRRLREAKMLLGENAGIYDERLIGVNPYA